MICRNRSNIRPRRSDVLKVISQSGAELGPVLDTLVETAARICLGRRRLHLPSARRPLSHGGLVRIPAGLQEFPGAQSDHADRGTLAGRTVLDRRVVHIEDTAIDPEYARVEAEKLGRQRTMLGVPLIREDALIGVLTLARSHVEPFNEKQIALVTTFADQAVIAIENARLFNELRARTEELGSSVDELKMLSEVGQAVSSTLDLRAVLSTILNSSLGLTWANAGAIFRYIRAERAFRLVEAVGWDEALARSVSDLRVAETETAMGEAAARRTPVQLAELAQRPSAPLRDVDPRRRFPLGADRAAGRCRAHPRGHHSDAARGGRIPARDSTADADSGQPIGIGDPERASLPRDCRQERATGARQPAQIAVPRQYEPRAQDPVERDPRLCRVARRRHLRGVAGSAAAVCSIASRTTASISWR